MLTELFRQVHSRYSSLPVLGPILDGFAEWLFQQGYRRALVRRHLQGARHADAALHVHALVRWYHSGVDVRAKLPFLSAYMGHVSIASTEYYLHFVDELAAAASDRFVRHCGALVTPAATTGGPR